MATLTILTGPSGAGKSTLAGALTKRDGTRFLEMDELHAKLSRQQRYERLVREARLRIANAVSFGIDTVFGGRETEDLILPARNAGYRVVSHIVGVYDPEICVQRVLNRARLGGHGHPPQAVFQLYPDALAAAGEIVVLSSESTIYDNSGKRMKPVARMQNFQMEALVHPLPRWTEPLLLAEKRLTWGRGGG